MFLLSLPVVKIKTSVLVFAMIIYGKKIGCKASMREIELNTAFAMCVIANHHTITGQLTHVTGLSMLSKVTTLGGLGQ